MNNNNPKIEKKKQRARFSLRFAAIMSILIGIAMLIIAAKMLIQFPLFSKGVQTNPDGINIALDVMKNIIGLTIVLAALLIVDSILIWRLTRKSNSEDER